MADKRRTGVSDASPPTSRKGRLNICYVIGSLQSGGAERHLLQITPELQRSGLTLCIYCLSRRDILAPQFEAQGITVIGPPLATLKDASPRFLRPLFLFLSLCKMWWIFWSRRPELCHFFLPESYILGVPIAWLAGRSNCVMSRRSLNLYQQNHPVLRVMEHRLHPRMKAILGNSLAVMRQLYEEGATQSKTHLIYNGYAPPPERSNAEKVSVRRALGLSEGAIILTMVANLIPYKGHEDLLNALAAVKSRMPEDWRLLLVGRDDGIGHALQKSAKALALSDHVLFLGSRSDVADIFAITDIALLCSHEEGFSNAIIEAMAAECPVIATDVGGNGEAIQHGATGVLTPPGDTEALSKAILELALDAPKRDALGAAGLQRFNDQFTLERCVARYRSFYDALLGTTRPSGHAPEA